MMNSNVNYVIILVKKTQKTEHKWKKRNSRTAIFENSLNEFEKEKESKNIGLVNWSLREETE